MRAGSLKERIIFQTKVPNGGDDSWGPSTAWVDAGRVRASVQAEAGTEATGDHAVVSSVTYTVRTRALAGITNQHRILWGDRTLDIVSVIDPTGQGRELEIKATENMSNG